MASASDVLHWQDAPASDWLDGAVKSTTVNVPSDRSFRWSLPPAFSQEWIDDLVLKAHCVRPVWSEFALVENRPSAWEIADAFLNGEDRVPFVADDSVVIVASSRVDILITISTISFGDVVRFQIGLHLLCINADTICAAIVFRALVCSYGLIQYPGSGTIDRMRVGPTGDPENAYLSSPDRNRLVFLFPRSSNLSRRAREMQDSSKFVLSAFGVVITNETIYRSYKRQLRDLDFDTLAIAPGGEAWPIKRDQLGMFSDLANVLEASSLLPEVEPSATELSFSRKHWLSSGWPVVALEERRKRGAALQERWAEVLADFDAQQKNAEEPPRVEDEIDCLAEIVKPREVALDQDGYPLSSGDIAYWIDHRFGREIELLPRARRELAKVRHPDPRRIAEALALLAGPKLRGYRGGHTTREVFDDGLIRLRMRDGFSNAQYLNGQTGDAYLIQFNGRRLLLERHLCSNASGFNDPRMIRIYYVYDRVSGKIIVGWLPTHLPTTQS